MKQCQTEAKTKNKRRLIIKQIVQILNYFKCFLATTHKNGDRKRRRMCEKRELP